MTERKIKVYSTRGKSGMELDTDVSTWGELQAVLNSHDYDVDISSMKAVVGQTKVTLEATDAILPETDFTLFLMPVKMKSGVVDASTAPFSEVRNEIKDILHRDDNATGHFNQDKNYTNKKGTVLRELLQAYYDGDTNTVSSIPEEKKRRGKLSKVIESVKAKKTAKKAKKVSKRTAEVVEAVANPTEDADVVRIRTIIKLLKEVQDPVMEEEIYEEEIVDTLEGMLKVYISKEDNKLSSEEMKKLDQEGKSLAGMFLGVSF